MIRIYLRFAESQPQHFAKPCKIEPRMKMERPTELPPEIAAKLEKRKRFPRVRRWLFNGLVVLSFALFAGNYFFWVRCSNGAWDEWRVSPIGGAYLEFSSLAGNVSITADWEREAPALPMSQSFSIRWEDLAALHNGSNWSPMEQPRAIGSIGCSYVFKSSICHFYLALPYWFTQLLLAILPLWWLWRWAERRAEKNLARGEAS
jgi:hypothetical protein